MLLRGEPVHSQRTRPYEALTSYTSGTLTSTHACAHTLRYTNAHTVLGRQVGARTGTRPGCFGFFFLSRLCVPVK